MKEKPQNEKKSENIISVASRQQGKKGVLPFNIFLFFICIDRLLPIADIVIGAIYCQCFAVVNTFVVRLGLNEKENEKKGCQQTSDSDEIVRCCETR